MLKIKHIELKDANDFVDNLHRHHKRCTGHRFSLSCYDEDRLCGVAIVGRPVARGCNFKTTVEVSRLCTDGTKNACSILYAAAARCARELGYDKIQTYILDTEPGVSLLAAGWAYEYTTDGGAWSGLLTNGKARRNNHPICKKKLYSKCF